MVEFCQQDVQVAQGKQDNIRCVCVIGDKGHGKSTLVELLRSRALKATEEAEPLRQAQVAEASNGEVAPTTQLEVHTLLFPGKEDVKEPDILSRRQSADKNKEKSLTQPLSPTKQKTLELEVQSVVRAHRVIRALKSKKSMKTDKPEGATKRGPANARVRSSQLHGGEGAAGLSALARASRIFKKSLDGKFLGTRTSTFSRGMGLRVQAEAEDELPSDLDQLSNPLTEPLLCYLMDTPGQSSLLGEAQAGLRLADSVVLVVNPVVGLSLHDKILLRRAAAERLQVALVLNHFDRCLDGRYSAKQLEEKMHAAVDEVNTVLATAGDEVTQGEVRVRPEHGELIFGSASQGWMISLPLLARNFKDRYGLKIAALSRRLWCAGRRGGAQDAVEEEEEAEELKEPLLRRLVLEPLLELCAAFRRQDWELAHTMLEGLRLPALGYGEKYLAYRSLVTKIMKRLAEGDACQVMCQLLSLRLPSPRKAQGADRVQHLFLGTPEGKHADALRKCSPEGPLTLAVARLLAVRPAAGSAGSCGAAKKYALGRIFCGSISRGQRLRVSGKQEHGRHDLASVEQLAVPCSGCAEPVDQVFAGNLVLLTGPQHLIFKSGTLLDESLPHESGFVETPQPSPVVRVSVRPKRAEDLPKLVVALRQLSACDPVVRCRAEEWGEHVISGVGELHLRTCIGELAAELAARESEEQVELIYDKPHYVTSRQGEDDDWSYGVEYKETVRAASASFSSSPWSSSDPGICCNAQAQSLHEQICQELEEAGPLLRARARQRALMLSDRYNWPFAESLNLWAFGPAEGCGTNVFVRGECHVEDLAKAGPAVAAACRWASAEGAICEEPLRGIRFELGMTQADTDETNGAQKAQLPVFRWARSCSAMARRALLAAALDAAAAPSLQEPWSLAEVVVPAMSARSVALLWGLLARVRGLEFSSDCEPQEEGAAAQRWRIELPTLELVGLETGLNAAMHPHRVVVTDCFMRWQTLPGSLVGQDPKSAYLKNIVLGLRQWRQLNPSLPTQDDVMRSTQ